MPNSNLPHEILVTRDDSPSQFDTGRADIITNSGGNMVHKKRIIDENAEIVVYQNGRRIVVVDKALNGVKDEVGGAGISKKTSLRALLWKLRAPAPPASEGPANS